MLQKILSLRQIAESDLDEARKLLLANVIETYLKLSDVEEVEFRHMVEQDEAKEVREMISIYEERGIVEGKRDTLLHLMRLKFGQLPDSMVQRIQAIDTRAQLDTFLARILTANSPEEMGLGEE